MLQGRIVEIASNKYDGIMTAISFAFVISLVSRS